MSGGDRRWDFVGVVGCSTTEVGGEGKVADRERLVDRIPLN